MKKTRLLFSLLVAFLCASVSAKTPDTVFPKIKTKKYHWVVKNSECESEIEIDYPISGPQPLVGNIQQYILSSFEVSRIEEVGIPYKNPKKFECDDMPESRDFISLDEQRNFVTVTWDSYVDMGGAHGQSASSYRSFLKDGGIQITKWSDVFNIGFMNFIKSYANGEFKECVEAYGGNIRDIELNSPPYFRDSKIAIGWNPYEIAPYACGYMEVEIPIIDAKKILKPDLYEKLTK